jgi:hypothetical protein
MKSLPKFSMNSFFLFKLFIFQLFSPFDMKEPRKT